MALCSIIWKVESKIPSGKMSSPWETATPILRTVHQNIKVHAQDIWILHMIRDPERMNLSYISRKSQALFLKYLSHKFLSGFWRSLWLRGLFWDSITFLESLILFMNNDNHFEAQKGHLVVSILSQNHQFWCTLKNEENGHLKWFNYKIIVHTLSIRVSAMIFWI